MAQIRRTAVDWALIDERIPYGNSPEESKARDALFKQLDPNHNKTLSLSECQAGLPALLETAVAYRGKDEAAETLIPGMRDFKPAVTLAFRAARDLVPASSVSPKQGSRDKDIAADDNVDRREFHGLLVYFRHYLELLVLFKEIDTSGDLKLTRDECLAAMPLLESWGIPREQVEYKFPEGSTQTVITFNAFADWCLRTKLSSFTFDLLEGDVSDTTIKGPEATAAGRGRVDWAAVDARIPTKLDLESKVERDALYRKMDLTKKGKGLSLSAVTAGLQSLMQNDPTAEKGKRGKELIPGVTDFRPAVKSAFMASRSLMPSPKGKKVQYADDVVDRREFHALLVYFRNYLELQVLFQEMDTSEDKCVSREEAMKAEALLLTWNIEKSDIEERFQKTAKGNLKELKFTEFADWCLNHKAVSDKMRFSGQEFDDPDADEAEGAANPSQEPSRELGQSSGFRDDVALDSVKSAMEAASASNASGFPVTEAASASNASGFPEREGGREAADSSPSGKQKRQRPAAPTLNTSQADSNLHQSSTSSLPGLTHAKSTSSLLRASSRTFNSSNGASPSALGGVLKRSPFLTSLSQHRSMPKITFSERGSMAFPNVTNQNPGPGSYNCAADERTSKFRMAPGSSMPHGTRFGFAENPAKRRPAPGDYMPKNPTHHMARKVGFGTAPRGRLNAVRAEGPGPGAYETRSQSSGPAFKQKGKRPIEYVAARGCPGPGHYDPSVRGTSQFASEVKVGFGTSSREDLVAKHQMIAPGPGLYDIDKYKMIGRNSAKFSVKSRPRDPRNYSTYVTPAPGWYDNHATSFGY